MNKARLRRVGVMLLLLAGFVSGEAHAKELRLVTGDSFPPFADRALAEGGIITEIVRRSFETAGYGQVNIIWRSWLKGFEMTATGEVDGTFPYAFTRSRDKTVIFSDPITNLTAYGWYANKGDGFDDNLELVAKTLCLPLGYAELGNTGRLLSTGQAARLSPPDMKTCFKLLAAGRVDVVVSPVPEAHAAIQSAGLSIEDFDHIDEGLSDMPLHFIVGRNHPDAEIIIRDFNAALGTLRESGELARILEQADY